MALFVDNFTGIEGNGVVQDPNNGSVALQSDGPSGNITIENKDDYPYLFIDEADTKSVSWQTGHNTSGNFNLESVSGEFYIGDRYLKDFPLTEDGERNLSSVFQRRSIIGCLNEVSAPRFSPPKSVGLDNTEGVSGTLSRSDHIHRIDNLTFSSKSPRLTSVTTSLNGNLYLTNESNFLHVFKGTATGYKIHLPDATTLTKGWKFEFWNETSQIIYLYSNGTLVKILPPQSYAIATLEDNSTSTGLWLTFRAFTGTATGILNYNVSSITPFTLAVGTADTEISGMSVTPITGTYAVWYSGSIGITGNNTICRTTIYTNGTLAEDSLRTIRSSVATFFTIHTTQSVIRVDGSQAVTARVSRNNKSLTIQGRSMILIRLGD